MSVHEETLVQCEDLLATLSAAQTHLKVLAALQLDFSSVLKVHRDALDRSRKLLAAAGVETSPGLHADLGGRDDTDELLSLAVHGGSSRTAPPIHQATINARAVPLDDGPEGTTDDHGPLQTDEVSGEASTPVFQAADVTPPRSQPVATQGGSDDVVVMEEDDWEPTGAAENPTEVMSADQVRARALALAALEEDPATEEEHVAPALGGDEEQTLLVDSGVLEAMLAEGADGAAKQSSVESVDDEEDQASVDEVIVTKADAQRQVAETRATPSPTPSRGQPSPKVKVKVKAPAGAPAAKPVSAQFYAASAAIPTIRDESTPKPRAAAVKLGAEGRSAQVLGVEDDDEPIAVEGLEDEDHLEHDEGGGLTLEVEEYEEWEDEEEELLELSEDHLEELELDIEAREPSPSLTAAEIADLLERARQAAKQGNLEVGVNYFSDVLDADPDCVDAYIGRGRLYLDVGDYSRAMSDFTVAEDLEPSSPEPQVAVGDLYFARKDYRKAIELFDTALTMKPDHAMAFCRRGISHYYRRNYRQALDDLNQAVKLDPEIPNIKTFVSMAKKKAGLKR